MVLFWNRLNILNLTLVFVLTVLLSGFQTTAWYQIFGSLPSPLLWLNLVLYLILYRSFTEGVLTIYAMGLLLKPFTAMPLGLLWLNLLVVFLIMSSVKKRVFWPGSRYFLFASFGIAVTYHLSYLLVSRWLESNPASFSFFHRFLEITFTGLTAVPMYALFSLVDHLTNKETSGGSET